MGGGGPSGGYTARYWFDGEFGSAASEVRLRFYGPDPDGGSACDEIRRVEVTESALEVQILIKVYAAENGDWASCPRSEQWATAVLDEPLGERTIVGFGGGVALRVEGDELVVVPESMPCGRSECNTAPAHPASCDSDVVRLAFEQIDGGIRAAGDRGCNGSFLVAGIDVGSGGCPPTEGAGTSPCRNEKRAFFVANAGQWRLVTYGTGETCESVRQLTGIEFPDQVCG